MYTLSLLLACTQPVPKDTVDPGDDTDGTVATDTDTTPTDDSGPTDTDTTVPETDVSPFGITAELSPDVVTVVRVHWSTLAPSVGRLEFGESADYTHASPVETTPSTEHDALILGMPADTDVHFRVVSVVDGGEDEGSEDQTILTGTLPVELPSLTVTGEVTSWVGGYQVLPLQGTGLSIVVLDEQGRIVWYDLQDAGFNLMRARLAYDGQAILYCLAGMEDMRGLGSIARVSMDGSATTLIPFPYIDHDFTELPDGTLAGIVVKNQDGYANLGDSIVELDADGTYTEIWSAWEDPTLMAFYKSELSNWSHANALDYVPEQDAYFIALKEIGTIVKVDRKTGASQWHLNGLANGFTMLNGTEPVILQHQFQLLDDGILIFDNGPYDRGYSQAVEFALDQDALTAEEVWSYGADPPIVVYAKGDVYRYDDGGTQVVWSSAGEIQNVDPDGNVQWQLNTPLGYAMTFVEPVPSLYVEP